MDRRIAAAVLVATVALAGCGGDGDGAGPGNADGTLHVSFSPNPIVRTIWEDWFGSTAYVTATVSPVPSEAPYVRVLATGVAFVPGTIEITAVGPESFRASLPIANGLAPGTYEGTLTVEICRDAAFTQPYALSQSTLPYTVTVHDVIAGLEPLTAVVEVDGAVVADTNEGLSGDVRTYSITIPSGRTVELIPSMPFLTRSATCASVADVTILAPSEPGAWRAMVFFKPTTNATTGYCELSGRADGGRTVRLMVNLTR